MPWTVKSEKLKLNTNKQIFIHSFLSVLDHGCDMTSWAELLLDFPTIMDYNLELWAKEKIEIKKKKKTTLPHLVAFYLSILSQ